jgi:hypothetical protein
MPSAPVGPDQQFVEGDLQGVLADRSCSRVASSQRSRIDAVFEQRRSQLLLVARFDGIDVAIEDERLSTLARS